MTIPLAVLTSGENVKHVELWGLLQDHLAEMSRDNVHIVERHASHAWFLVAANDAQTSGALILKVMKAVRTGEPLRAVTGAP